MSEKVAPVRWGFIGAGMIAKKALYPALQNSEWGEIYVVALKDAQRAKALSPSGRFYTDYQEIIDDPNVEAIYISLPNSLHIPWSIKAMEAGKDVLCEKPLAMNAQEVRDATKVAQDTGRLFMEASWNRWHPRTKRLAEIVHSGEIGAIEKIKTCFTYDGLPDENIRAFPELGGGGLYDLGPYSVAAPLWLMNFAPTEITKAEVAWHHMGSDETVRIEFTVGKVKAEAITSMNVPSTLYFEVFGSAGAVVMGGNDAFNSHNKSSTLEIYGKHGKRTEEFAACDPYQLMADDFSKKVRGRSDCWIMSLDESLIFAEFFDSVFEKLL